MVEKRFNGYVPKSMKTARAQRLLTVHGQLEKARKRTILFLALAFLAIVGLSVLFLIGGSFSEKKTLVLALLAVYGILAVLAFLFFGIGRILYGGKPDSRRVNAILKRYLCGLLGDTYRVYEREIIGRDHEQLLKRYALEYITEFRLLEGERERLLANGALAEEGEKIRRRYEDFITFVISGDEAAERYINLRRNMAKVLEKWRHNNLGRYDKPQRAVIEENIKRVVRMVSEQYERFLSQYGVREYVMLLNDVTFYDITEERSLRKPLPTKKKYKAFCRVVKQINDANPGKMIGAGRGNALFDYALALQSYRAFTKNYATVACPSLKEEIKVYEDALASARRAQDACWKCGEKYHPRFRVIRDKCKHYICNRCNVCYCMSPESNRRRNRRDLPPPPPDLWMGF